MNFIFECSTRYLTSERSERVRYRVEHERIKFISTSGYVIFFLLYKHRINSCEKGAIYYVAITRVISSRVKITYYLHVWRYEVFAGKLTWYFTGVYIINRGYYMPARGYEFYLRMLPSISHDWAQRTSEISSWTREDKIRIHKRAYNVLFLLYKHTNDDFFTKISGHFPKILQKLSESQTNVSEHFPKITYINILARER